MWDFLCFFFDFKVLSFERRGVRVFFLGYSLSWGESKLVSFGENVLGYFNVVESDRWCGLFKFKRMRDLLVLVFRRLEWYKKIFIMF